ncbi:MAG: UDP-2,3-diacylglucosamine diphosphatase LpxI [Acetobacter sp.]|nr:UDP-2,3-diacylglucosamine diphosphatase LpxI [Acetobacter sp.]MBO6090776.1 UDP-2,3-diacylglucosamine diphosphatase LpxI [Acetobacter sp.]MBO7350501.1 UDP-2,3-diacylglucosamine diphosphatase LpxI [Acetobacter sp.]
MVGTIGILAGEGVLPARVAESAYAAGHQVYILGFEGFAEASVIESWPHDYVRLGAAGQILTLLRRHGCTDLVLIGPVRRPSLSSLRPDIEGARILTRLGCALFSGDDGLLAALVRILGEEGFRVRGAHEFLQHSMVTPGVLSQSMPDAQAVADIQQGITVVRTLGALDIGQGCVVQNGVVLAVEAMEGTDRMLMRAGECRQPGAGGVFIKLLKPMQEKRIDMPTIGPKTIEISAMAGLRGIAFEAGNVLIAEKEKCVAMANQYGLFLVAVEPEL